MQHPPALRNAPSRQATNAPWRAQQASGCHGLVCLAAGGQNGTEPQLSEEEVKQMTEDFMKEVMQGAGADDPESKKYKFQVTTGQMG